MTSRHNHSINKNIYQEARTPRVCFELNVNTKLKTNNSELHDESHETMLDQNQATQISRLGSEHEESINKLGIKRVAVAGASGELGIVVLRALIDADFEVTALNRSLGKLPDELTTKVKEVAVDYNSTPSIIESLKGNEALVITLTMQTLPETVRLIHAAVAAGVQRVIPSIFTCNLHHLSNRMLPVFGEKVHIENLLEEKARQSQITYTFIYNNAFLDWGIKRRFFIDPVAHKATLFDGGDTPISFTRLSTVGKAVARVLKQYEHTRNRRIYVHDGRISVKSMLESLKELSPAQEWTVHEETTAAIKKKSDDALGAGIIDEWVWFGYILCATMSSTSASFGTVDNRLLGLDELSEDMLKDEIKKIAQSTI